jgi:hypothetical protein
LYTIIYFKRVYILMLTYWMFICRSIGSIYYWFAPQFFFYFNMFMDNVSLIWDPRILVLRCHVFPPSFSQGLSYFLCCIMGFLDHILMCQINICLSTIISYTISSSINLDSPLDDKRYILDDGINSLAYGNWII